VVEHFQNYKPGCLSVNATLPTHLCNTVDLLEYLVHRSQFRYWLKSGPGPRSWFNDWNPDPGPGSKNVSLKNRTHINTCALVSVNQCWTISCLHSDYDFGDYLFPFVKWYVKNKRTSVTRKWEKKVQVSAVQSWQPRPGQILVSTLSFRFPGKPYTCTIFISSVCKWGSDRCLVSI
jgi:hypothetical protein